MKVATPPRPPGPPPTSTEHWEIKPDPSHPADRRKNKWVKKAVGGGYQTPVPPATFGDLKALNAWIGDMREWGLMMHEAVVDLRGRMEHLEKCLEKQCP
ncbi:MAG: hypothetical protein ACREMG_01175 [Gemmatimonadales bacterium]